MAAGALSGFQMPCCPAREGCHTYSTETDTGISDTPIIISTGMARDGFCHQTRKSHRPLWAKGVLLGTERSLEKEFVKANLSKSLGAFHATLGFIVNVTGEWGPSTLKEWPRNTQAIREGWALKSWWGLNMMRYRVSRF